MLRTFSIEPASSMGKQALRSGPAPATASRPLPHYEFDAARSRFNYAWTDLKQAFVRPKLILTLIRNGFLSRYQGTVLGGLWITITTGVTASALALLYGKIFATPLQSYFPFVAIGIVVWGLISSLINDGAGVFLSASVVFNQSSIPKSIFALRSVGIAAVAFLFKLIVLAIVVVASGLRPGVTEIALSLAGLAIILWTGFWFAIGAGTIGARFRDLGQLASTFVTLAFFFTPVFWQPARLGSFQFVVDFNPLYHFVNIVRGPLIGADDVMISFIWAIAAATLVAAFGLLTFGLYCRRLCYWT